MTSSMDAVVDIEPDPGSIDFGIFVALPDGNVLAGPVQYNDFLILTMPGIPV